MNEILTTKNEKVNAKGKVVKAFGNLLQVEFEGNIRQGEIAMVAMNGIKLKAEVIEIVGHEAKVQVYEDTKGIEFEHTRDIYGRTA